MLVISSSSSSSILNLWSSVRCDYQNQGLKMICRSFLIQRKLTLNHLDMEGVVGMVTACVFVRCVFFFFGFSFSRTQSRHLTGEKHKNKTPFSCFFFNQNFTLKQRKEDFSPDFFKT
ncbi:Hypothetical predicted protein [Octopus vulgaris]|uniref:Uncharacterized protein n=1 Tax=Octopus vulgaris TaxID=6645 RepID=A0AA36BR50_OCTVU|nr:Hypothetical predicted protein [Octopus vulgaris]